MNLVIPLQKWSLNDFTELRYSLRSFQMYLPHDKLYIIGHKPKWLKNVEHMEFIDDPDPKWREYNIYAKLLYYVNKIGKDFIYTNDDHFMLQAFDSMHLFKESIKQTLDRKESGDPYRKTILNTMRYYPKALNWDIHYPMQMTVGGFRKLEKINWKQHWGYCMKTLYAELNQLAGKKVIDLKINDAPSVNFGIDMNITHFSTSDKAINDVMIKLFKQLYPKKSRYE